MPSPLRKIEGELLFAKQVDSALLPKAQSLMGLQGQRYERRVLKALAAYASARGLAYEAGPWFTFRDAGGEGLCVPDALLRIPSQALIVEVKLTYTPAAFTKLSLLYKPVVEHVLGVPAALLIIVKHMAKGAPHGAYSIREALSQREPVMQWLGHGALPAGEAPRGGVDLSPIPPPAPLPA